MRARDSRSSSSSSARRHSSCRRSRSSAWRSSSSARRSSSGESVASFSSILLERRARAFGPVPARPAAVGGQRQAKLPVDDGLVRRRLTLLPGEAAAVSAVPAVELGWRSADAVGLLGDLEAGKRGRGRRSQPQPSRPPHAASSARPEAAEGRRKRGCSAAVCAPTARVPLVGVAI